MQGDNIRKFIQANYSDQQLADAIAHAESGRLGWNSCCCITGMATAKHPLQTADAFGDMRKNVRGDEHLEEARLLPYAVEAESEFLHLSWSDPGRRKAVLEILYEERDRRDGITVGPPSMAEPALVG